MENRKLLSNNLIVAAVPTIISAIVFIVAKKTISESDFGAIVMRLSDNFLFVMPTSILTSTLIGFFIYISLNSFLRGYIAKTEHHEDEMKRRPLLSRRLQVIALTVIAIYASFTFQQEVLTYTQNGIIGIDILPDFTIVIPSVILVTIVLGWLTFMILAEFVSSLSQDAGYKNAEGIQRLTTGGIFKKTE